MSGEDDPKFLESEDECDYVTPIRKDHSRVRFAFYLDENMEGLVKKTNMKRVRKEGYLLLHFQS